MAASGKKVVGLKERKQLAELEEKRDLEASKIVRFIPRTDEEILGMDRQQ